MNFSPCIAVSHVFDVRDVFNLEVFHTSPMRVCVKTLSSTRFDLLLSV